MARLQELLEVGQAGFRFCGVTVGETLFGGMELVVITKRPRAAE